MPANELTADDLRSWGVLYHYMMKNSAVQAQRKLEQAMQHPDVTEQVYSSAAQQRIALLCDRGRGREEAMRYDQQLAADPSNYRLWLLCTAAHEFAEEYDKALEVVTKGIARFPDKASLYVHAGDICRGLKRYDEAFAHWHKALNWITPIWTLYIPFDSAMKNWSSIRTHIMFGRIWFGNWTAEDG